MIENSDEPISTDKIGLQRQGMKVLKTILNLVIYFKIDENLKDLFHYNEFSSSFEYAKDFQWPEHDKSIRKGKRVEDEDIVFIQYYLCHNKHFEIGIDKIRNALIEQAARKSYHPVKEYLDKLEWDGVKRLDEWLIRGCGVEDNIYTRQVGRKWVIAATTRIYEPGTKFDSVLTLEGVEDIGKSSTLRTLGGNWFTDSVSLLQKEPDIVAKMVGNWIIELAEMKGIRKQESEFIKGFLSCQYDEQRLAFRRDPKRYPRQSVFAGTSNNMAYLLDAEGNRRFWPVRCHKIDIEWIKINRDQIFAEAKNIYDKGIWPKNEDGEKLFLEGETNELAKKQQKMRLSGDEVLEEQIERYLLGKDETTMSDILLGCLKHDTKDSNLRAQQIVVGRILMRLGFEKKDTSRKSGDRYIYLREKILTQLTVEEEW